MSDMPLGLPFWSSSCICCRLTIARMSLLIYQPLNRAYYSSAQEELTDHDSKEVANGFANSLFLSKRAGTQACVSAVCDTWSGYTAISRLGDNTF
ncbi:hypothetical protein F383_18714 [Gossypium arboreum]|uniref:Uncharacterized protein n=1 Tax=Gossypium arboreum TaxID=29729 RepID=A0A0B0NQB5_GOSAR|nr:hypothetical protein F383_18714 [Gossypium arboreum]